MRIARSLIRFSATIALLAAQPAFAEVPVESETQRAEFVLSRIAFGPSQGDVQRVAQMGVSNYIDQQLHPERIPFSADLKQRLSQLTELTKPLAQLFIEDHELVSQRKDDKAGDDKAAKNVVNAQLGAPSREVRAETLILARDSPRQLQEMLTDFWFNHFNVFAGKELDRVFIATYQDQAIRPYVLGHFRDMLEATARHPAMLYYLDNWKNVALVDNPPVGLLAQKQGKKQGDGINENYAREVMELHTLGVNGGYSQTDVTQLAHILTGWGFGGAQPIKQRQNRGVLSVFNTGPSSGDMETQRAVVDAQNHSGFFFNANHHDFGTKVFLNHQYPGTGQAEGEQALDALAYSPVTARHCSYELAQYFVADQPPATLVQRMTDTWVRTSGDLRAVTETMLKSPEFWDKQYRNAKYKTPLQYVVSVERVANVELDPQVLSNELNKMGELPQGYLTPDGYKNTADAWLTSSATEDRLTFASQVASGQLEQMHFGPDASGKLGVQKDPGPPTPLSASAIAAVLGPVLSQNTQTAITGADPSMQAAMVLGSPEMMRR